MFVTNIKRIFRGGFVNFWRSGLVSLASLTVMTLSLFVIGGLYLSQAFLDASLADLQSKVDISVSFQPEARTDEILTLQKTLQAMPAVRQITYRTREQELADFIERNKDNALIMQSLDEVGNPLGARLNISAVDPSNYENIAQFLKSDSALSADGENIIYQISFKKDNVDRLVSIIDSSRRLSVALAIVLIVISIIVTFATISLAIYVSREEISIMRLVGADRHYVRGPFVIEGIIVGIFAAIIALALLYPTTLWLRGATAGLYGGVDLAGYYLSHFAVLFLILFVGGMVLGAVSSFWAVSKYLKV